MADRIVCSRCGHRCAGMAFVGQDPAGKRWDYYLCRDCQPPGFESRLENMRNAGQITTLPQRRLTREEFERLLLAGRLPEGWA